MSIDESGFAHDMPRTHGYAPRGQRCYGLRDWHARGRTNVIGALLGSTLLTGVLCQGSINSEVFHTWVIKDLLPQLPDRVLLVMDNAAFHQRQDIKQAIQTAGHRLLFLPPYSPDLNPIEHTWAQAKALRKRYQFSVRETLQYLYNQC